MASAIRFCLALLLLTGYYLICVRSDYNQYVSLISDVQKYYKTSSVFFIFSRNNRRMQEYTMVHLLSRTFSDKGVVTLIINFVKLDERLNSYRKRISRPLIVVLLKSAQDIAEFNESTQKLNKSYPIWLVIFYGNHGDPFCKYCVNPVRNILKLRFDTLMLVMCCDDLTLKEWWSVHDNETQVGVFGTWTPSTGLEVLVKDGIYSRRHDVDGTGLRIVLVSNSSLVHDYGYRIGGFLGEILRELKNAMNFTITNIYRQEGFGSYNETDNNWTGVIGVLARGEADLALSGLSITNTRLDVVDFTYPLMVTQTTLYIKEPSHSPGIQWSAYFQAFRFEIWMTIIIIVITSSFLLAFIKIKGNSISLLSVGIEHYLCVWGIFCQQGLFEFPTETSLRIAYFSIYVSALVLSAAYSASMISYITLSVPSLSFSTFAGFANDGTYKLIVHQNSSDFDYFYTSTDPVIMKMMKLMKPRRDLPVDTKAAFKQVCSERVAFYVTSVERITEDDIACNLVGISSEHVDSLAIALPLDSKYTDVVNYHIERFKSNGIFNRLKQLYYLKQIPSGSIHDAVELSGITPLLSLLVGGVILALFVLFGEKIYHSLKKYNSSLPHSIKSRKAKLQRWFSFRSSQQSLAKNVRPHLRLQAEKINRPAIGYYP